MPIFRSYPTDLRIRAGKTPKIVGQIPYDSESNDLGFIEVLKPGCFSRALNDNPKILSLWNHDSSKPLANTKNGSMVLTDTAKALFVEITPDPSISWAADAIKAVKRGDIGGLSFGFTVKPEGITYNHGKREVHDVEKLFEVSPVAFPAYPETTVAVRNRNIKRGKKMNYSMEEIQRITNEMKAASGSELIDLGEQYDQVAPVVIPDTPLFSAVGYRGIEAFLSRSKGRPDKTYIDSRISTTGARPFSSFGEQLRSIIAAGDPNQKTDDRLFQIRAATGLNEGTPSDGGFLVQSNFSSDILSNVWNNNEILKRVKKYPLGDRANGLKIPGVDETSRVDGSRSGGVQAYWLAEAGEITASKPTFRMIELQLNKLVALCYLTGELMEDVNALEAYVNAALQAELDFKLTDAIINGSGAGQPLGIKNAGSMVTVSKESGQSADTIVYENVLKMWARLLPGSRKNAIWCINQNCETQLNQMSIALGTAGTPVYLPAGGASVAPYGTLFGRPVIPIEQAASLGDLGDIMLCDFTGGYVAIDRAARFDTSIHLRFLYDEEILRAIVRFDGQPVLASAITPFASGATDTLSHFVQLEAR